MFFLMDRPANIAEFRPAFMARQQVVGWFLALIATWYEICADTP